MRPLGLQCALRVHVGGDSTRSQIQGRRGGLRCLLGGGVIQNVEASKTTPIPTDEAGEAPAASLWATEKA